MERIRESQPRIMGVDWSYDIHGPDAGREGSGSNKKKRAETEQSEDVLPDYSETFAEDVVPAAGRPSMITATLDRAKLVQSSVGGGGGGLMVGQLVRRRRKSLKRRGREIRRRGYESYRRRFDPEGWRRYRR